MGTTTSYILVVRSRPYIFTDTFYKFAVRPYIFTAKSYIFVVRLYIFTTTSYIFALSFIYFGRLLSLMAGDTLSRCLFNLTYNNFLIFIRALIKGSLYQIMTQ